MFSRFRVAMRLALLFAVLFAIPVFAGGWAVITLDRLPAGVVAGEPLTVGFTVMQHGRTPMANIHPTITAMLSKPDTFIVNAKPEGKMGHYVATLTFPKQGNWSWSIQAFTMDQAMPELSVAAPNTASVTQPAATAPISTISIIRILALVIGLAGLVVAYQRKSRLAMALTVLCLLIGVASFVTGSSVPARVEAANSSISQVDMGRQLFIAKGCVTCHTNTKIPSAMTGSITVDEGPNLTNYSASSDYLTKWLFKPSAIKPATRMPDLNLSENEITALIAFINSK